MEDRWAGSLKRRVEDLFQRNPNKPLDADFIANALGEDIRKVKMAVGNLRNGHHTIWIQNNGNGQYVYSPKTGGSVATLEQETEELTLKLVGKIGEKKIWATDDGQVYLTTRLVESDSE